MGQTVEQLEDQIKGSRVDLRSNLEELGQTVKSAVDWREKFRANPGAVLAVAFGGGLILANIIGGSRSREESSRGAHRAAVSGATEDRTGPVLRAWNEVQRALAGVVAAKITHTLAEVVPGIMEQLRRGEDRVINGAPRKH